MVQEGIDMKMLNRVPRLLIEVELQPVQGDRFQPTGFADLGAAIYENPKGKRMILVESAQSIANRLEQTCLNGSGPRISPNIEGIPYILAKLEGEIDKDRKIETETSSLVEAHRINSPFIISNDEFKQAFKKMAGYEKGVPLNWNKIAETMFFYDPNSLLHGAFMANLEDGRVKVQRAITGVIEAEGVREVASGGVKNNPLDPTGKIRAVNYGENVYSNVPYHRMEYTADSIVAYFNFDLALIDGYGLKPEAKEFLVALGLYKIRKFLARGLRLRTACDLALKGEIKVTAPEGFVVPDEEMLLKVVQKNIKACADNGLFADPPLTVLETPVVLKSSKEETAET
jgi:CRISPR-associated protein Csb1